MCCYAVFQNVATLVTSAQLWRVYVSKIKLIEHLWKRIRPLFFLSRGINHPNDRLNQVFDNWLNSDPKMWIKTGNRPSVSPLIFACTAACQATLQWLSGKCQMLSDHPISSHTACRGLDLPTGLAWAIHNLSRGQWGHNYCQYPRLIITPPWKKVETNGYVSIKPTLHVQSNGGFFRHIS